jgi:membrane-associated phospholipid phosphatase
MIAHLYLAAAFLTDFADEAVLLPAAALIAVLLALAGWRRGAIAWSLAFVGTLGLILLLKLALGGCGQRIAGGELESPSGHTAAAGVFYGSILACVTQRAFGRSVLTLASVLAVVALIGGSRIVLGVHTIAEVCLGAAVGFSAALAMVRLAGPLPANDRRVAMTLLPAAFLVILLHGLRLPAEAAIRDFAQTTWPFNACR